MFKSVSIIVNSLFCAKHGMYLTVRCFMRETVHVIDVLWTVRNHAGSSHRCSNSSSLLVTAGESAATDVFWEVISGRLCHQMPQSQPSFVLIGSSRGHPLTRPLIHPLPVFQSDKAASTNRLRLILCTVIAKWLTDGDGILRILCINSLVLNATTGV